LISFSKLIGLPSTTARQIANNSKHDEEVMHSLTTMLMLHGFERFAQSVDSAALLMDR